MHSLEMILPKCWHCLWYGYCTRGASQWSSLHSLWFLRRWLEGSRAKVRVEVDMLLKIPLKKLDWPSSRLGIEDQLIVVPLVHHYVAHINVHSVIEDACWHWHWHWHECHLAHGRGGNSIGGCNRALTSSSLWLSHAFFSTVYDLATDQEFKAGTNQWIY